MLPRLNRLSRQKDFAAIFGQPAVRSDGYWILKYAENQKDFSRFAVVIGARVIKRATERNRLRRQVAEILRCHLDRVAKGRDIALILKRKPQGGTFADLERTIFNLFRQGRLLINP